MSLNKFLIRISIKHIRTHYLQIISMRNILLTMLIMRDVQQARSNIKLNLQNTNLILKLIKLILTKKRTTKSIQPIKLSTMKILPHTMLIQPPNNNTKKIVLLISKIKKTGRIISPTTNKISKNITNSESNTKTPDTNSMQCKLPMNKILSVVLQWLNIFSLTLLRQFQLEKMNFQFLVFQAISLMQLTQQPSS